MPHIPSNDELKEKLTPEEYHVLREGGTELPYTGEFLSTVPAGVFVCKVCAHPLFATTAKFDSMMGWPAFDSTMPSAVEERASTNEGKPVTEVLCAVCKSHLGTYFENGYTENRKHYCINAAVLVLDTAQVPPPRAPRAPLDTEETTA